MLEHQSGLELYREYRYNHPQQVNYIIFPANKQVSGIFMPIKRGG